MNALGLGLGIVTWSFLEYCIHRWLGHDRRFRGNIFGQEHTRHHSQGDYFAPTWKKLIAALAALGVLGVPAYLLTGMPGVWFSVGLIGFYGFYEVLHRREHTHRGIGAYGRWARRHHFFHHFVDPRSNHGVTSPIWDFVFGTHRAPEVIPVPEKLKMIWLTDETGDVCADLTPFYRLRRARAR